MINSSFFMSRWSDSESLCTGAALSGLPNKFIPLSLRGDDSNHDEIYKLHDS